MSFRSAARNSLGNNLSNFKSTAPPVRHEESDDGDDDNYDYDSEEEEERLLSRRHGEAEEDPKESNNDGDNDKKRKPTDEEIAAEYNKNENAKKKQRLARRPRNITEMDLVQPNGLSTIFTTFPHKFRKQNYQTNRRKDMAKFSRQLILAYQQWSNAIVPNTPWEEVAWKIQTLNSKTTVKRFLQTMRDQVRNDHVERLFGLEKAEQMIAQLNMALSDQDYDINDNGLDNQYDQGPEEHDLERIVTTASPEEGEEEPAANSPPITEITTTNGPAINNNSNNNNNPTHGNADLVPGNTITPAPAVRKQPRRHALDDSSDEEELTFDDSDAPRTAAPSMRRPVLEESDDEDDNNDEVDESTKTVPPASGKDIEIPRKDETVDMDESTEADNKDLATGDKTNDESLETINPYISVGDEAKAKFAQQTGGDEEEEEDDDEAEFEFDTQPVHPKISTTQVTQNSEPLHEATTNQDINPETIQTAASTEVSSVRGESGLDHYRN